MAPRLIADYWDRAGLGHNLSRTASFQQLRGQIAALNALDNAK
jgi:hypothetical protein